MIGIFYDRNGNKIDTDILDLRGAGWQRYEYTNEFWLSFDEKTKDVMQPLWIIMMMMANWKVRF